ncbi:LAMA3 [Cordylochernes scorpioides]|uniref:LAMA3 n=1 Tax=Cordylochernes scorpioides TaxID=51811 RepID=A0ABY6L9F6_9ARAC|nr:LAMA3 [Cordylochernes scorpioides]
MCRCSRSPVKPYSISNKRRRCAGCEDECTGLLFHDLDYLSHQINSINLNNMSAIPWSYLLHLDSTADSLRVRVDSYSSKMDRARALANNYSLLFDLETQADMLYGQAREILGQAPLVAIDAYETFEDAKELLDLIRKLRQQLFDLVEELAKHGLDPHQDHKLATDHILDEAEKILRELKTRDFTPYRLNAEKELR